MRPTRSALALTLLGLLVAWASAATAAGLNDALASFRAGQFAAAEKQVRALLQGSPQDAGARFWLARCLVEQRQFPAAEAELRRILETKPASVDSRYWLGVALAAQGRTDEAREQLSKVLGARPQDAEARAALAKLPAPAAGRRPTAPTLAPADPNRRIAVSANGLAFEVGEVNILSSNVYDYTFSVAPTDWVPRGGVWRPTNRWTCSPQWSWYGGYDPDGLAASWNKHQFLGDVTVEVYAAMKMGVGADRRYKNPNDMNICLHGDGANLDSGYNFVMGGGLNEFSRIMKGGKVLAETTDTAALFPVFEDGYPQDMYDFHRKWWALRVRLCGEKLEFYKDGKLILQAEDPDPLPGGRVALWTMHNGIVVSRAKVYFQAEKVPPDPVPADQIAALPPLRKLGDRALVVDSPTHPAVYDDFELDVGRWQVRDPASGVKLTLVSPGADGKGHALAIVNQNPGGQLGATFKTPKLDARKYGWLSFDYRVDPEVKVNLQVVVSGGIYEIGFTAPGEIGPQGMTLADLPGIKADGQWRHAEVDLRGYLDRIYKPDQPLWIEDVYFANTHTTGYIHAGFGGNHAGATLSIDNFYLGGAGDGQAVLTWRPVSATTVAAAPRAGGQSLAPVAPGKPAVTATARAAASRIQGVAYLIDSKPYTEAPEGPATTEAQLTQSLPGSGVYYAHVRAQLPDGAWSPTQHQRIVVDRDPPKLVGRAPANGEASGAATITARLVDTGGSGVDKNSLKLVVQGKEFSADGVALTFEPKDGTLVFDPARAGMTFEDGQPVAVELTAADRLGHAFSVPAKWQWRYARSRDKTPPAVPYIVSQDGYLCRDDFETDLGQWSNFGGPEGAVVCRDPSTAAAGQYSLRLYSYRQGGRFGAKVRNEPFNAGKYRLMSFDYKVTGRLRADFALYVNDRWKSIKFTDNDNPQPRIGEVPEVRTDGQWHHADVDLHKMLSSGDPAVASYQVRYLILGDWGYMGNAQGRTYYIDNFEIAPVVSGGGGLGLSWKTFDTSGIAGASFVLDHSPTTDPGTTRIVDGASARIAAPVDGLCWFHVRAVDKAGNWSAPSHLRLIVDKDNPTAVVTSPQPNTRVATSRIVTRLADPGPAGVDPATIKLKVAGQEYDVSSACLAYNATKGELVWDGARAPAQPIVFPDGQTVSVELVGAADFAGNPAKLPEAYAWTMDYSQDNEAPTITAIKSTSHLTFVSDTFEDGLGQWQTRPNEKGGQVELDEGTAAGGRRSLKVTNPEAGGAMGVLACREAFSADRYPLVSFDYNFAPGTKLDLVVEMDDQWHAVALTGNTPGAVGQVNRAAADGQWHHATIELATLLRAQKQNGPLDIQQVVFTARDRAGNAAGATAHIDNFVIGRVGKSSPTFRWSAADATGITDYSYGLDQDPTTVPDEVGEGPTASKTFRGMEGGEWYFHVRAKDGAGHWGPAITYAILHLAPRPNN